MSELPKYQACPDPGKGIECEICGAKWICCESWRKKPTWQARKAEFERQQSYEAARKAAK